MIQIDEHPVLLSGYLESQVWAHRTIDVAGYERFGLIGAFYHF